MPLFKFKVSSGTGRTQEILVEGDDQRDATVRVRGRGLIPIEFLGQAESSSRSGSNLTSRRQKFDVVTFTDRLVPLIEADIPLERALQIIERSAEAADERELVGGLRRGLHEGRKFSQLIADRGRMFPRMYAGVVEAGEESGSLPQVMQQMRDYLVATKQMNAFIISASIYPVFVVTFCMGVVMILLGVVVPKFTKIIDQANIEVGVMTHMLISLSDIILGYWWMIFLILAAVIATAAVVRSSEAARERLDRILLRIPIVGEVAVLSDIGRQIRTMSILMQSGVPLLETVSISAKVLQNSVLRSSFAGMAAELRRGERLSAALSRSPYVPTLVVQMLAVGEETGKPEAMLIRVAERYDAELQELVKRTLAWFEPLVIILLGGVVGLIVFILFMTLSQIQSGYG